jgi:acetate kinase
MYSYRIRKYIGAYYAALGRVDAVVFTAGIGENSAFVRQCVCTELDRLGIIIDATKNRQQAAGAREIQSHAASVKILVIPTNEEVEIARQTAVCIDPSA